MTSKHPLDNSQITGNREVIAGQKSPSRPRTPYLGSQCTIWGVDGFQHYSGLATKLSAITCLQPDPGAARALFINVLDENMDVRPNLLECVKRLPAKKNGCSGFARIEVLEDRNLLDVFVHVSVAFL